MEEIGNVIGSFFYMVPQVLGARDKRVAWIVVEVNFSRGCLGCIEIKSDTVHIS